MAETTAESRSRTTEPSSEIHHRVRGARRGRVHLGVPGLPLRRPAAGRRPGRRKNAIARVRIVPGTGKWKINGRTLEDYFPNKVHQQEVNEPFKVLELDDRYDVIARIAGGGVSGQAGALRLGVARALNEADVDNNRGAAQEGRLPHP